MKRKERSLERLSRVQKLMHDLAKWRHASVEHENRSLRLKRDEMIEAIGRAHYGCGALGAAAARHAQRIETRIVDADDLLSSAAKEALAQGMRAKLVSDALMDTRRALEDVKNRKALSEIADAAAQLAKQA